MTRKRLKVGCRVKDKYTGFIGVVINIWDGRYTVPYYGGEQFNPYRITVRFGQDYIEKFGSGVAEDGRVMRTVERLEVV